MSEIDLEIIHLLIVLIITLVFHLKNRKSRS